MSPHFILPDLESPVCALFPRATNPHYGAVLDESREWFDSFSFFPDKKRAYFQQCIFELLASHSFPYAEYSKFRVCCDWLNLVFAFDEVSDEQNGPDARKTTDVYIRAMRGLTVDEGDKLYQATKEFRERLIVGIGPRCFERFSKHSEDYVNACAVEAQLRDEGKILSIQEFLPVRRDNSGVRPGFDLIEYCLGIDLPEFVFENPTFQEFYWASLDMICWQNDLYSYSVESAKGIGAVNFITVLMEELGLDIQGAADYVSEVYTRLFSQYEHGRKSLPSWDPETDMAVARYVNGIGCWLRGNIDWSFETPRYFGQDALEVKRTRIVKLPSNPRDGTENVESVV
ncbi:terpenoid synthase [Schizophyllum commune Tattone D]|nr:terpenoid synthase [Schizophyllum commune Tattone D]